MNGSHSCFSSIFQNPTKQIALGLLALNFLSLSTRAADPAGEIDYGAAKVNAMGKTQGTKIGGKDEFNYLALANHQGPSGVPVGGIGAGCFDYAPDGRFTRVGINNWHSEGESRCTVGRVPGSFLAVWQDGKAQLLHRAQDSYAGMPPAKNTIYRGLFPVAECKVDDAATVCVWSGLVPQDLKDSTLPLAWVEVQIANPSNTAKPVAVAFSWQDVIAREIRDFRDLELLGKYGKTVWEREKMLAESRKKNGTDFTPLPRVPTTAAPLNVGAFTGIRQSSEPLQPVLKSFQNYNNEIAILAEQSAGAEITTLPAFPVDSPSAAWEPFLKEGRFASVPATSGNTPLFDPAANREMASAVAVRLKLNPGEKRTVRFLVSWFQPELDLAKADPCTYFGKADYGRYYQRSFPTQASLIAYAVRERERIWEGTRSWHSPVLASTYPDWLKFKLINSAYTLYTNTILNKAGDFTVMEGGMGGLAGTMDQRISAHPFYFKFFTPADRSDLELFGHTAGSRGQILHFDGHYYWGLSSRDGATPVPENSMVDNSGGWLLQLAKDYQQNGDLQWLSQFKDQIPKTLNYLRTCIRSKKFQIITGATTYDDFWHPELYAYNATTYPAVLKAGAVLFRALGDETRAQDCEEQSEAAAQDAIRALWNGRYFAYGADLDGGNRRDDIMFSGQLAGQFLSRCFGLGNVLPPDVVAASVVSQLKTNVVHSPDYYAPKVWLVKEQKAMDDPRRPGQQNTDSTCWPFYLESYTAMTAIQAGYLKDGLEIMRHIQLLHLRNGWTWTQNLWRPGELTYVTGPVTWFITDVLAGTALDLSTHTLHLAPVLAPGETRAVLPVYFPRFWATVTADRKTKKIHLKATKVFPGPEITMNHVITQPVGTANQQRFDIPAFKVTEGAELDLSKHWGVLMGGNYQSAVLPKAEQTPFLEVKPAALSVPELDPNGQEFSGKLEVKAVPANQDAHLFYTVDGSDPRKAGIAYKNGIELNQTTKVAVAARTGKVWSPVRRVNYIQKPYLKPNLPADAQTGRWHWRYYEGEWTRLPDFSQLTPRHEGEVEQINRDMRKRKTGYGLVFEGAIEARQGVYSCVLASDDGARVTIDGEVVCNHDGIHNSAPITFQVPLETGHHGVKIEYFQNSGGADLKFEMKPQP